MSRLPGTIPDKLQPHNLEAEESVLGSLMIDPDAIVRASSRVSADDFYIERHRWLYDAVKSLYDSGTVIDLVTVADKLETDGKLKEFGGQTRLVELFNNTFSSAHVEYYADIVRRTSILRKLIGAAGLITKLAYVDTGDIQETITKAAEIILPIFGITSKKEVSKIGDVSETVLNKSEERSKSSETMFGITTGLIELDKLLDGFIKKQLVIIAGRPGMGKTALAIFMAMQIAFGGNPNKPSRYPRRNVGFISMEMTDEALTTRVLASISNIDSRKITKGEIDDWVPLIEANSKLANAGIYIKEESALTIHDVRVAAMKMVHEYGIEVLFVDYLQLMNGSDNGHRQNREQDISEISRGLKILATELDIVVIALSQLSRELERRQNKRPMLSDLRESGSIEQNANVVMFIYRDEIYNPDTEFPNIAEIIAAKNREGAIGTVLAYFKKPVTQFIDLETHTQPLEY